MGTLGRDVRYALRVLAKSPGFAAVAVLTLALAIGANTAIFTLIDALMLRSLPGVKDPQELVLVTYERNRSLAYLTYPDYERLRDEQRSLGGLFASGKIAKHRLLIGGAGGQAQAVQAQAVSASFFEVLGVPAALGRALGPDDDRPGDSTPVVVLSYGFWQRRFGSDPAAIGAEVMLDDVPFTIAGVAPRGFCGFEADRSPDLWWPIYMAPLVDRERDVLTSEANTWVRLVGRLRPGVAWEQASAEWGGMFRRMLEEKATRWGLSDEERTEQRTRTIALRPGGMGWAESGHEFGRPLVILMGIVAMVLLVACANLAGLLLARGTMRHHELSTRMAMGASRWAVARQLITESLLLAAAGGLLGLFLAQWGVTLLAGYLPGYGETVLLKLSPDLGILGFTFLVSASTGVLFGLIPAWRGSRIDLAEALKDRTAGRMGAGWGQRWNRLFVVSQIALSACLLIGAGLFVRTVQKLNALDCGFAREHLLVFDLEADKDYGTVQRANLCREVLQRLQSLPGVRCVSFSSTRSLTGADGGWGSWQVADGAGSATGEGVEVTSVCVAPQYFETMGIPLLRGREFLPHDEPVTRVEGINPAPPVAIVDETLARRLFGNEDPVGRRLRSLDRPMPLLEIVGVAANARHSDLREQPGITLYNVETNYFPDCLFFYVRTLAHPSVLAPSIRRMIREVDPTADLGRLRTMHDVIDDHLFQERAVSQLAGLFSLCALALACLGLYGTLSYGVARRTQEIGLRIALGARAGDVLALVLRQGMVLALAGCVLGLVLAVVLTRIVSSLLYGVAPTDPLTYVLTVLLLLVVALQACYFPARRAAKIDPMVALKHE